jgi:hypothetical protein
MPWRKLVAAPLLVPLGLLFLLTCALVWVVEYVFIPLREWSEQ